LEALVELAATAGDPLRREGLLRRADEVFGVEVHGFREALRRALALRARGEATARPIAAVVERQRTIESYVERKLLATLLQHPAGLERARAHVAPADFRDPACAELARWLWAAPGGAAPEPVAPLVRELLALDPEPNGEDGLEVAARVVASRRIRRELQERRERLRGTEDVSEQRRLEQEIIGLTKTLTELGV
ncbi:MAG TPA: hypothetical protein VFK69_11405, partial [Candidatus Eisenbacteria bacterium]|nr:hypothetical protein [Candidatus Eisenbacteria bacterium]